MALRQTMNRWRQERAVRELDEQLLALGAMASAVP
jgi:uncharacterized protein YjiS (DUF1127 family)